MPKDEIANQIQQAAILASHEISSMIENTAKDIVNDKNIENKS